MSDPIKTLARLLTDGFFEMTPDAQKARVQELYEEVLRTRDTHAHLPKPPAQPELVTGRVVTRTFYGDPCLSVLDGGYVHADFLDQVKGDDQ